MSEWGIPISPSPALPTPILPTPVLPTLKFYLISILPRIDFVPRFDVSIW